MTGYTTPSTHAPGHATGSEHPPLYMDKPASEQSRGLNFPHSRNLCQRKTQHSSGWAWKARGNQHTVFPSFYESEQIKVRERRIRKMNRFRTSSFES